LGRGGRCLQPAECTKLTVNRVTSVICLGGLAKPRDDSRYTLLSDEVLGNVHDGPQIAQATFIGVAIPSYKSLAFRELNRESVINGRRIRQLGEPAGDSSLLFREA
jgi:hypothetical protein